MPATVGFVDAQQLYLLPDVHLKKSQFKIRKKNSPFELQELGVMKLNFEM
jgi:hypothetical protein